MPDLFYMGRPLSELTRDELIDALIRITEQLRRYQTPSGMRDAATAAVREYLAKR